MTEQDFSDALQKAYHRAGTQQRLADQIGVSQSTIAGYFSGRYSIGNMTISTLLRLFPDMVIDFFGSKPTGKSSDLLRVQLLEIFDGLTDREKVACIAYVAKNFGSKMPEKE